MEAKFVICSYNELTAKVEDYYFSILHALLFSSPSPPAWCTHQFCSVHLALRLTAQDPFFNLNIFTLRQYIFSFVINFSIAGAMGATF